ncbi:MAG: heavy metal response regulator transcription factor [Sutterella sp.]|nr:heavy metal response regulator transcription factor [Sutterella sp.]
MKILVIEDEEKTGSYLKKGLEEAGFSVELFRDGTQGYSRAISEKFDLIVLDVLLPGIGGFDMVPLLRKAGVTVPVLMLTALSSVENRVKGLEAGADDYLGKPFAFAELLARVRTLLRRSGTAPVTQLRAADLVMDLTSHTVSRGGVDIALTAREFKLLEFFLRHKGEVLTRSLIAGQVWDINFESGTNAIDVAVKRLRAKCDQPFPVKLITTVRGIGYCLKEDPL